MLLQKYLMISFCGMFFRKQEGFGFVVSLSSNFWSIWVAAFISSELLFAPDTSELIYKDFFDLFFSSFPIIFIIFFCKPFIFP